jgi:quercetin dioxygenase-like cupin family protein
MSALACPRGGSVILDVVAARIRIPRSHQSRDPQAMQEDLSVEVLPLSGLVDYQDGAVVSRTLVKKSTGSVTVFAFDKGQELSEHTVPHDAFVYVIDGETEITVAGTPHRLRQGDAILMPGGRPHAVRAVDRFKMILSMIRAAVGPGGGD